MSKVTLKSLVESFNTAPSGSFIGITDYESENGNVSSITGQIGCSYQKTVELKIEALKEALSNDNFEEMTVKGQCWAQVDESGNLFDIGRKSNTRKLVNFCETYTKEQVKKCARDILYAWENPKPRVNNKVQLTDKEDGLSLNTETNNFNFTLLVQHETFKQDLSDKAKSGKEFKVKATHPLTVLKEQIRKRFEKKIKSYTISEGKFASITISGNKFLSEDITF